MTLTTEQLNPLMDIVKSYPLGKPVVISVAEKIMLVAALKELLANLEVQPVGYTSAAALDLLSHGDPVLIHKDAETTTFIEEEFRDVIPLYTAPPAPAVPEEMKRDPDADVFDPGFMNGWNACRAAMLNHVGETNEKADAKCECSSIDYCENCLRAMLAQPVSSGYKLVPVELTDRMIDAFNETPPGALSIEDLWRAMLAAAPEGGNDHDTRR